MKLKDRSSSKEEAETTTSRVENILNNKRRQEYLCTIIEAIEAVIEKKSSQTQLELEINGGGGGGNRRIKETPLADLIAIHENSMIELRRLSNIGKRKILKNVYFRF